MLILTAVNVILKAQPMARILHQGPQCVLLLSSDLLVLQRFESNSTSLEKICQFFSTSLHKETHLNPSADIAGRVGSVQFNSNKNPKAYRVCRQVRVKTR